MEAQIHIDTRKPEPVLSRYHVVYCLDGCKGKYHTGITAATIGLAIMQAELELSASYGLGFTIKSVSTARCH